MFLYIYLNIAQTINDYDNKSNKMRKCLWGSKSQNNLLHKTYIFNIISVTAPPNCWPENNWGKKIVITVTQTDVWNLWMKFFFSVHFFPIFSAMNVYTFNPEDEVKVMWEEKGYEAAWGEAGISQIRTKSIFLPYLAKRLLYWALWNSLLEW